MAAAPFPNREFTIEQQTTAPRHADSNSVCSKVLPCEKTDSRPIFHAHLCQFSPDIYLLLLKLTLILQNPNIMKSRRIFPYSTKVEKKEYHLRKNFLILWLWCVIFNFAYLLTQNAILKCISTYIKCYNIIVILQCGYSFSNSCQLKHF